MERKKIGIGYEDYKRMIDDDCYYVDKTLLVRDILKQGGMVTLLTRPRRFGKTLALSMLRTFFEAEIDSDGRPVDNSRYFVGMKVMGCGEKVLSKMGKHPVIKLSLKSAKQPDFRTAMLRLRDQIVSEFLRHEYLCGSKRLSVAEIQTLKDLMLPEREAKVRSDEDLMREMGRYATSLQFLSSALAKHHGQNAIVLLDEYDVPLENAYFAGFYERIVAFIRSLFESVLKTNDALEFAVVTGCLRISRESIFTGLNHLKINSIRDDNFAEGFGFTEAETESMLRYYGMENRISEAKEWYNGYLFGDKEVYNPWSVTSYADAIANNGRLFPEPYWSNTSSNAIVKDLVWHADEERKRELELLIDGGAIEKRIHEDVTYGDIHESDDNLWNFLFFTGYLKKVSERKDGKYVYVTMRIPNQEIACIYEDQVRGWFDNAMKKSDRTEFYKAVLDGDTEGMEDFLTDLLDKCISTFDSSESFYHGFFLSFLYGVPGYNPRSNREKGDGRPDIVLEPRRPRNPAIIFEVKVRKKFTEMQDGLKEAFGQIRDRRYEEGVLSDGFFGVKSYGVCFCKKTCVIGRYPGRKGETKEPSVVTPVPKGCQERRTTMEYMTRRSFVEMATIAAGGVAFAGLPACSKDGGGPSTQAVRSADADTRGSGSATETSAPTSALTSAAKPALGGSRVYFAHDIDGSALQAVFAAIGRGLGDGKVGVKLSSGEPGGNYDLRPTLIEPLVSSVSGTIVECNTAYGGSRSTIDEHYKVAADHGFTRIADFQIMDETGSLALSVEGGFHLAENLVGAAFADYDGFLVLSHFKGHSMAGFGGALKNISIGMASREGKLLIHSAGENRTSWQTASQNDFLESMADACQAVMAAQPNMLFVNVMNNLSVNCDCESNPAPPKMADIGVLASDDPVALDQACVDLVYASDDDSADLIERMESRNGVHVLEAADSLGVGSRTYELVEIDG